LVQSAAVAVVEVMGAFDVGDAVTVGFADVLVVDGDVEDEHPGRLAAAMPPSTTTTPSLRTVRFTIALPWASAELADR
jgi:hypothetical protein